MRILKYIILPIFIIALISCKKIELSDEIVGTWKFEHCLDQYGSPVSFDIFPYKNYEIEILEDGSISFNDSGILSSFEITEANFNGYSGKGLYQYGSETNYYLEFYLLNNDSLLIKRSPYNLIDSIPVSFSSGNLFKKK